MSYLPNAYSPNVISIKTIYPEKPRPQKWYTLKAISPKILFPNVMSPQNTPIVLIPKALSSKWDIHQNGLPQILYSPKSHISNVISTIMIHANGLIRQTRNLWMWYLSKLFAPNTTFPKITQYVLSQKLCPKIIHPKCYPRPPNSIIDLFPKPLSSKCAIHGNNLPQIPHQPNSIPEIPCFPKSYTPTCMSLKTIHPNSLIPQTCINI